VRWGRRPRHALQELSKVGQRPGEVVGWPTSNWLHFHKSRDISAKFRNL
jgi:hypothetical protein